MSFKEVSNKIDFPAQERELLLFWKQNQSLLVARRLRWRTCKCPDSIQYPCEFRVQDEFSNRKWCSFKFQSPKQHFYSGRSLTDRDCSYQCGSLFCQQFLVKDSSLYRGRDCGSNRGSPANKIRAECSRSSDCRLVQDSHYFSCTGQGKSTSPSSPRLLQSFSRELPRHRCS